MYCPGIYLNCEDITKDLVMKVSVPTESREQDPRDLSDSRYGPEVGSCEYGNERSASMRC